MKCPNCSKNLREGYGLIGGEEKGGGFVCGAGGIGQYWYCSSDNCGYFHKILDSDEPDPPKARKVKRKSLWKRFWEWLS